MGDTERLLILADACSDLILGGERGWERMDFKEFTGLCRKAIAKANKEAATEARTMKQEKLMKFCPATGKERPYPSHADQWRDYHGTATAWLFNPWEGTRRDARDVGSDTRGLLIADTIRAHEAE